MSSGSIHQFDPPSDRKARGAFFTPPAIANVLADWAIGQNAEVTVLDPSCGESVFLLAATRRLRDLGVSAAKQTKQVFGVDLHRASLRASADLLRVEGLSATLIESDFFDIPTPNRSVRPIPLVDAVIGNPPFIRYQDHAGTARQKSASAALAQGVRLSGMASSWAALLVHSSAFLKPNGCLAMVLPAELLTVHYAEPIRRWLRNRFASVHLVMFDRLQFDDALERVVLLIARGSGGCDSFALHYLNDAEDLYRLHAFDKLSVTPADQGKWTDLLLAPADRHLFNTVADDYFVDLNTYGQPELGTVTGANDFFLLSDETRALYGLSGKHLVRTSPPGSRHLKGLTFTNAQWKQLRDAGEQVWMLYPQPNDTSSALAGYTRMGKRKRVHLAYKCQVRTPWWRPPMTPPPDLFFTYMSHRYPRLVTNSAGVTFVNSMHGVRLRSSAPKSAKAALPVLVLNSVTMLGAEVRGRSYGGGVLKMEPREAALLPVPTAAHLDAAWARLKDSKSSFDRLLRQGLWVEVAKKVDEVLLGEVMGLDGKHVIRLHEAARSLRERRIGSPSVPR